MNTKLIVMVLGLCLALPTWSEERHEHMDIAHGHNHSYPIHETHFEHVPMGARYYDFHGDRYWWHEGVWYRPRGSDFVVVGAPLGIYVPILPAFATAVVIGGASYYYANETYYQYRPELNQYEVVSPPVASVASAAVESPSMSAPSSAEVFVYPRNGQSADQTAKDRYECHAWAVSQTGFDPTVAGGGQGRRADYLRAQAACLEGRGYTVK